MPKSREYLYDLFKNNRKPNEDDFKALIDSSVNLQDDRPNAGWYYFHFLPSPNYLHNATYFINSVVHTFSPDREFYFVDKFSFLGEVSFVDGTAFATLPNNDNSNVRVSGSMKIFLPKEINRIVRFRILGSMDVQDTVNGPLLLNLRLTKSSIVSPVDLFTLRSVTSFVSTEFDESDDVDIPVNPNEDALFLSIDAYPRRVGNRILVKKIGIQFS